MPGGVLNRLTASLPVSWETSSSVQGPVLSSKSRPKPIHLPDIFRRLPLDQGDVSRGVGFGAQVVQVDVADPVAFEGPGPSWV